MKLRKSFVDKFTLALMGISAILITICGIMYRQSFVKILPLYISIVIMFLQSKVDRKALLLGGLNSLLYTVVYISFKLYASAANALLVSFPLQLISFFRWNKNQYANTTVFHRLTGKQIVIVSVLFAICWGIAYVILSRLGSNYLLLDITVNLVGILGLILTLLAYIEYTYLSFASNIFTIFLYMAMIPDNPEQITYLIFSLYGTICAAIAVFYARQFYKNQQSAL